MSNPNVLTQEEATTVREYVFLLLLIDLIDKNTKQLEFTSSTLKPLYLLSAQALHKRVQDDLLSIRKFFRDNKIKVEENENPNPNMNFALHYVVYFRGYNEKFSIMKDIIKGELGVRLGKYINGLGRELNGK
jgi:hypothetical protein